jgi:DNA-binding LacI/PurR family transcriptional regulator
LVGAGSRGDQPRPVIVECAILVASRRGFTVHRLAGGDLGVGFTDVQALPANSRSWAEQLLSRRPVGVVTAHWQFTVEQHAQLAASGIPLVAVDPTGQPYHSVPSVAASNWSGAVAATQHLLGLGHRRIGVYEAARPAGLRIPQDLSVLGFDDITATLWCGPPMTTVRQPFREIGAAAGLLLTLIAGEQPARTRIELPTTLAVRASTAPPPSSLAQLH